MTSPTHNGSPDARRLYLELLKKSLTNTLFAAEPDTDRDQKKYVHDFIRHYIKGSAISMLPQARMDNLQQCVVDVLQRNIPGDLIETGVWRGGATIFMRGVLKAYSVTDRRVWVADSFQGLPEPDAARFPTEAKYHATPLMKTLYGKFAVGVDEVKRNFEAYGLLDEQVRFLVGWFKDTLPSAPIKKLAVMRLDGDYYDSTMDSLTALYDKLSPGGYVIIDDYGEDVWTNCRQATEDFRQQWNITTPLVRVDSKCYFWQREQ